jgi:hypothetical protein
VAGRLRYFLYRDDQIVSQFLEQLEGGVYDQEDIKQQASGGGSVGVGIKAGPVTGNADRSKSSSAQSELSLRQTGPSRFSRFHELASAEQAVQLLDGCDNAIWDQLGVGEILDAGITLNVPEVVKGLRMLGQVSDLMPLFGAIGEMTGDDGNPLIDPAEFATMKEKLPMMGNAAAAVEQAGIPVTATLIGDSRYKFFLRLKQAHLQGDDFNDLEGEARLVGSIQSKLAKGKAMEVGQLLPGLPTQNRAQRRGNGASPDPVSVTLRYPGAVITPIAIFR